MLTEETNFLGKKRFNESSNDVLRLLKMPDFRGREFAEELLPKLIKTHSSKQQPRLKSLKRYYLADNDIKYRKNKRDQDAADNRIASDWSKYITIFEQGYMLGKPIMYKNENDDALVKLIEDFGSRNNESYHNIRLKNQLAIYGRAYELLSVENDDGVVDLTLLDAEHTFVVYNTLTRQKSLFAVRYYKLADGSKVADVYTPDEVLTFMKKDDRYQLVDESPHAFGAVPVNEYANNDDRTGSYEAVLDNIDAYDLSQSELANYQQNSNDALLVISGAEYAGNNEPDFFEDGKKNPNGRLAILQAFRQAGLLVMTTGANGEKPSAEYLIKEYDVNGAEAYKKRLVADILRFTFTPDVADSNFSGTNSGEAQKYKMMASDNLRALQERLFSKGLMRRLRLAANIWHIKYNAAVDYDAINKTSIIYTPNIPRTESEIIKNAIDMKDMISKQTILDLLKAVTGIDADAELERILNEQSQSNNGNEDADEDQ